MDYEQIVAAFLTPTPDPPTVPSLPATPARRLRDALEPVATVGWWSRPAADGLAALGLDFVGGYVWGRAASLGAEVEPAVVVSAFGAFAAPMIAPALVAARATVSRSDVLAAREAGSIEALRAALGTLDTGLVETVGSRLLTALRDCDGTGRPLFTGLRTLPVPEGPLGVLWRAAELFREHRGDGHLAASVAAGLDQVQMNVLTELWLGFPLGEYSASRAYSPERIEQAAAGLRGRGWLTGNEISAAGRDARERIEAATDATQADVVAALEPGIDDLVESATALGEAVLAAGFAPVDPRKRAAG